MRGNLDFKETKAIRALLRAVGPSYSRQEAATEFENWDFSPERAIVMADRYSYATIRLDAWIDELSIE